MKIGFIGLGSMGALIARQLAHCGLAMPRCDILPEAHEAFEEPGTARG